MMERPVKVAIFGHYGNANLGDEAIIQAAIDNLQRVMPQATLECFSINPHDSAERHGVNAFPIRYRSDYFEPQPTAPTADSTPESKPGASQPNEETTSSSLKASIKRLPLAKPAIDLVNRTLALRKQLKIEARFVRDAQAYLADFDLLLITGSNQLLDNFGGPWGFPYTLLKWSWIARKTKTKVAYVSVGAGPIYRSLSFFLLKQALRRADYISYRDEGSRQLIKQRIGIDGDVYPDIAHSLTRSTLDRSANGRPEAPRTVAVNPMPVYDRRYWYHVDDGKYEGYVEQLAAFCHRLMSHGDRVVLFNTQSKDENVMDDVVNRLAKKADYPDLSSQLVLAKNREVDQLMKVLNQADLIVATRFHATVLPVQLGKPVMGVCYYRKAMEQLADIGMGEAYMPIDDLDADTLYSKYLTVMDNYEHHETLVRKQADVYRQQLDQQYRNIADLIESGLDPIPLQHGSTDSP